MRELKPLDLAFLIIFSVGATLFVLLVLTTLAETFSNLS